MSETWVKPVRLEGRFVTVEPLTLDHATDLFEIGQEPELWQWLSYNEFRSIGDAQRYVEEALALKANGEEFPFAVVDRASGRVAGTTRYLEIAPAHKGIEIGWTWYGESYRRTATNSETKLLLMTHAFEALGAHRVQFKTDSRNIRSQTAIARLGAVKEGVLRNHRIVAKDGYVRDSVYFSVITEEWPAVKARLQRFVTQDPS